MGVLDRQELEFVTINKFIARVTQIMKNDKLSLLESSQALVENGEFEESVVAEIIRDNDVLVQKAYEDASKLNLVK